MRDKLRPFEGAFSPRCRYNRFYCLVESRSFSLKLLLPAKYAETRKVGPENRLEGEKRDRARKHGIIPGARNKDKGEGNEARERTLKNNLGRKNQGVEKDACGKEKRKNRARGRRPPRSPNVNPNHSAIPLFSSSPSLPKTNKVPMSGCATRFRKTESRFNVESLLADSFQINRCCSRKYKRYHRLVRAHVHAHVQLPGERLFDLT